VADLLTHVLVPYVLLTAASWRYPRIETRWVVVGMAGAAIPDLVKIDLILDEDLVASLLGVPFSYDPISSVGGLLLIAGAIAVFFEQRRRAYAYLVFGGLTALVLDGLRVFVDGQANFWLYPIWWRPPTPGLYVTSDARVLLLALLLGLAVFLIDRF
jgi:hypothetical protein